MAGDGAGKRPGVLGSVSARAACTLQTPRHVQACELLQGDGGLPVAGSQTPAWGLAPKWTPTSFYLWGNSGTYYDLPKVTQLITGNTWTEPRAPLPYGGDGA